MKKSSFIVLIVLISVLVAASLAYVGYTANQYLISLEALDSLETTKSFNINNLDSYINHNEQITDISLEEADYSEYEYVYNKDNIYFLSNTDAWNENHLKGLAEELFMNKHGEEIKYISSVILNESAENGILGSQKNEEQTFEIPVSLYNFLPADNFNSKTVLTEINLYQANRYSEIDDIAIVLSHEYGHHFTNFYFDLTFTDTDKETEYYKLRGEGVDGVLLAADSFEEYIVNHKWYLVELAAEDYVYFMGSPRAHRVVDFYDSKDMVEKFAIYGREYANKIGYSYKLCRNGTPHENITLGLPSDIEGLEEYFYSFIDENVPNREKREDIGTLNLSVTKPTTRRRVFAWDEPFTDPNVVYTLILYNMNDDVICMPRTVRGSVQGRARIGHYEKRMANTIYSYWWDRIPKGTWVRARVSVTFPDGTVMLSDPLDFVY
ncbi:MAG: hypothetical protein AB1Z23_03150 [Eubacteriales bacterium]